MEAPSNTELLCEGEWNEAKLLISYHALLYHASFRFTNDALNLQPSPKSMAFSWQCPMSMEDEADMRNFARSYHQQVCDAFMRVMQVFAPPGYQFMLYKTT